MQPKVIGYWEGYPEDKIRPFPLIDIPSDFTHIPIAFCAPCKSDASQPLADTWCFDDSFTYPTSQILRWVEELREKNRQQGIYQHLLLSFQDTPTTHWFPDVNLELFAKNVARDVYKYGFDGINIDAESGMKQIGWGRSVWRYFTGTEDPYAPTFIKLIKLLRNEFDILQKENPTTKPKLISYTCYTESEYDKEILTTTKDEIDYLTTMAYWDNLEQFQQLFQHYAEQIGDSKKVGLGFKSSANKTPLHIMRQAARWLYEQDCKTGMLWSITRDIHQETGVPDGCWGKTLAMLLHGASMDDVAILDGSHSDLVVVEDIKREATPIPPRRRASTPIPKAHSAPAPLQQPNNSIDVSEIFGPASPYIAAPDRLVTVDDILCQIEETETVGSSSHSRTPLEEPLPALTPATVFSSSISSPIPVPSYRRICDAPSPPPPPPPSPETSIARGYVAPPPMSSTMQLYAAQHPPRVRSKSFKQHWEEFKRDVKKDLNALIS